MSLVGIGMIDVLYNMIDSLYIEGSRYPVQLIKFKMIEFDVILGMVQSIQHKALIDCHKKEIMVGQDNDRPMIFRAKRARVNNKVSITSLHRTNQINGTNPIFVVWWSVKGVLRVSAGQI